jgi:hypothetical protein
MSNPPIYPCELTEDAVQQLIQGLYMTLFNHSAAEVTCWTVTEGVIAVVLEHATTLLEQRLIEGDCQQTAQMFRKQCTQIFERHLKALFSENFRCSIEDILSQYQPETDRMSLMIIQNQGYNHRA